MDTPLILPQLSKMAGLPPRRIKNTERRPREYLLPQEVEALMEAARKSGRHGHRDATLLLLTYRHGLRVSELVNLVWAQVDLTQGLLHVNRKKHGTPSTHPLRGSELRALRRLQRDYPGAPQRCLSRSRAGP
jgi:type 1 fimbriae regulatory protein FimE